MAHPSKPILALALLFTLGAGAALPAGPVLGIRHVENAAEPLALDGELGVPLGRYGALLERYVVDGKVDYQGLHAEKEVLRRFTATLAEVGPESAPERFPTEADRLAYYINAYNALVLLAVVEHWPISSVQDVRGWIEPKAGFGFFYGLRFDLDGERVHLYGLEHQVIRGRFGDARIHAAINCASGGCPTLESEPFYGAELYVRLDAATRRFCSGPPHVQVDDGAKEILLSEIFDWFHGDFEDHISAQGEGAEVLDFIMHFAEPEVAKRLREAREAGYAVRNIPYDWSLNLQR